MDQKAERMWGKRQGSVINIRQAPPPKGTNIGLGDKHPNTSLWGTLQIQTITVPLSIGDLSVL